MYYFKKPVTFFVIRLVFATAAFIVLATLAITLYSLSSQAYSSDAADGLMVLGTTAVLVATFCGWQIYQLVADLVEQPSDLVGFVVAKDRILKKNAPARLGQIDFQPRVKGYTLRLLPPEWLQEYYDEAQGLAKPVLRNRPLLLWRDRQTLFRVPRHIFDMVLDRDLVRIIYGKRKRLVFGLEVVASITPPGEGGAKNVKQLDNLLPDAPPFDAEPAEWREIED